MKSNLFFLALLFIGFLACSNNKEKGYTIPENNSTETSKPKQTKAAKIQQTDPPPKEQMDKAQAILKSVDRAEVAAVDAKQKYKVFCATCHGFKGDMNVNGAKDLTISTIPIENAVAQVFHGKGLMTPFNNVMSETEIVAVCKYIETLRK